MCAHHLLKSHDLEFICPYCRTELHEHEWNSEFSVSKHYKCTSCNKCKKKICITVNFHGSGHDNWREEKNLSQINSEEKLQKYEKVKKSKEIAKENQPLEKLVA
ncbi:MAG: hypothetical protein KAQ83_00665 [Nanoarchaeota archaeon]|nr:hypothetical protein [Nanoarchaeota archaeon]